MATDKQITMMDCENEILAVAERLDVLRTLFFEVVCATQDTTPMMYGIGRIVDDTCTDAEKVKATFLAMSNGAKDIPASPNPDAALLALGLKLARVVNEPDDGTEDFRPLSAVVAEEILAQTATTFDGLAVKAQALASLYPTDPVACDVFTKPFTRVTTDEKLIRSILGDLLKMGKPV